MSKAVALLSGGLDSAVQAAYAKHTEGYEVHAVCFDYGQRHREELIAAGYIAEACGLDSLRVIQAPMPWLNCSLVGGGEVAIDRTAEERSSGLAPEYVPARNTIFVALAAGYAESIGADRIVVGWTVNDHAGFPDCTPQYRLAMNTALRLGTANGVQVGEGMGDHTKASLIFRSRALGVPLVRTWTCYAPVAGTTRDAGEVIFTARHCGRCDACLGRKEAFVDAGRPPRCMRDLLRLTDRRGAQRHRAPPERVAHSANTLLDRRPALSAVWAGIPLLLR